MLWFTSTQLIAGGACGVTAMTPKCERCDGTFWVCEAHDDLLWDSGATSPTLPPGLRQSSVCC
jgi:hypothetical protein